MSAMVNVPAVENFLGSLEQLTVSEAMANLRLDMRSYGWSPETVRAIAEGISRHYAQKARDAL